MRLAWIAVLPLAASSLAGCGDAPPTGADGPRTHGGSTGGETTTVDRGAPDAPAGGSTGPSIDAPPQPEVSRKAGVVFVHGTGDAGDTADLVCSGTGDAYRCVVEAPLRDYWTPANVESQRTRSDGSKRPYAVVGCKLGTRTPWTNPTPVKADAAGPEPGSAECVADQAARFLAGPDGKDGTSDDITDVVVVTHSGGSNVLRYLLAQHTARPSFDRLHRATRRVVAVAPPSHGTYLANYMFRQGSLGNVLGSLLGQYDDDGVAFIQTDQMDASNRDPARFGALAPDVAGVPFLVAGGTRADATILDAATTCAGGVEARGLAFLHDTYLKVEDPSTYRDTCSDGFISCRSAMATTLGQPTRVVFGRLDDGQYVGRSLRRNHNQSRRDCDATDVDLRAAINGTPGIAQAFAAEGAREALPEGRPSWTRSRRFARVLGAGELLPLSLARGATLRVEALAGGPGVERAQIAARDLTSRPRVAQLFAGLDAPTSGAAPALDPTWTQHGARADVARLELAAGDASRADGGNLRLAGHAGDRWWFEGTEPAGAVELAARPVANRFAPGAHAEVDIAFPADGDVDLRAVARAPDGARVPTTLARTAQGTWTARVPIPARDGATGSWTMDVEADGRAPAGRDTPDARIARSIAVAFAVAPRSARIADAARVGDAIDVGVVASEAGLYGVHVWLGAPGDVDALHVQASASLARGEARVRVPAGGQAGARVLRVALVRHDLAATVDELELLPR